ncbi:hypothetical protein WA026_013201 [Henosepilachna vigintioctopunctata]|uniref:Uncharacterized protein n=1 Tax=Henosepilachna vigintioctopunctata TaxID=420089 RepID=A0AAW1UN66_9CUCU
MYPKYGKLKSTLETDAPKKCCGFVGDSGHVVLDGLGELLQPVSLPAFENYGITQSKTDDVKPVTEIIEDDLKYDFRTKTHYIR